MASSRRATAAVLLAWSLLAVGDALKEGEFAYPNLILVVLGFLALVAVAVSRTELEVPDRSLLMLPVAVCALMAVVKPPFDDMDLHPGAQIVTDVLSLLTALAAGYGLFAPAGRQRAVWASVLGLAIVTALVVFIDEPAPTIDVWVLLEQSSDGLLHGKDMYRQHWVHSTGLQAVYPYLPITTVALAPFRWVLRDVRYGLLLASLVGAWLVRRISPTAPLALAALLLIVPDWQFLMHQSWTEPLLIAGFAGSILAMKADRPVLAVLGLAFGLACKQHMVIVLPLFAVWPCFGLRRTIAAGAIAGLAVLPWFIAGPGAMWHDVVHANLALGVQTRALNLPSLFLRHGVTVGFWLLLLFLAAAYGIAFARLPRTPSGLALGAALVIWSLDLANKETYFNHYQLPLGLLVVALAAAEHAPSGSHPEPAPGQPAAAWLRGRTGASRPVPAEVPAEP